MEVEHDGGLYWWDLTKEDYRRVELMVARVGEEEDKVGEEEELEEIVVESEWEESSEEEDNTVWGSEEGEVFSDGEGGILQWARVGRMVENPFYSLD